MSNSEASIQLSIVGKQYNNMQMNKYTTVNFRTLLEIYGNALHNKI